MLGQSGYSRAMPPNVRDIERRLRSLEQQLERVGDRTSASTAEAVEGSGTAMAPLLSSIANRGCGGARWRLRWLWVSLWSGPAVPLLQAPRERPADGPAAE